MENIALYYEDEDSSHAERSYTVETTECPELPIPVMYDSTYTDVIEDVRFVKWVVYNSDSISSWDEGQDFEWQAGSYGDIILKAVFEEIPETYAVTYTLDEGITINHGPSEIKVGEAFPLSFSFADGYTLKDALVKVGGEELDSDYYTVTTSSIGDIAWIDILANAPITGPVEIIMHKKVITYQVTYTLGEGVSLDEGFIESMGMDPYKITPGNQFMIYFLIGSDYELDTRTCLVKVNGVELNSSYYGVYQMPIIINADAPINGPVEIIANRRIKEYEACFKNTSKDEISLEFASGLEEEYEIYTSFKAPEVPEHTLPEGYRLSHWAVAYENECFDTDEEFVWYQGCYGSLVLYPVFEEIPSTYAVTYTLGEGLEIDTDNTESPNELTVGSNFVVCFSSPEGYILSGVSIVVGGQELDSQYYIVDKNPLNIVILANAPITGDIKITANRVAETYHLCFGNYTYTYNDGNYTQSDLIIEFKNGALGDVEYTVETTSIEYPEIVVPEGYRFLYWGRDPMFGYNGEEYIWTQGSMGDVFLYPVLEELPKYEVTPDLEEGLEIDTESSGDISNIVAGEEFDIYFTTDEHNVLDPENCSVKVNGEPLDSQYYEVYTNYITIKATAPITGPVTIVASQTLQEYTITFTNDPSDDADVVFEGEAEEVVLNYTVETTTNPGLPTYTLSKKYKLSKWKVLSVSEGSSFTAGQDYAWTAGSHGDIVVVPVLQQVGYDVTYTLGEGVTLDTNYYEENSEEPPQIILNGVYFDVYFALGTGYELDTETLSITVGGSNLDSSFYTTNSYNGSGNVTIRSTASITGDVEISVNKKAIEYEISFNSEIVGLGQYPPFSVEYNGSSYSAKITYTIEDTEAPEFPEFAINDDTNASAVRHIGWQVTYVYDDPSSWTEEEEYEWEAGSYGSISLSPIYEYVEFTIEFYTSELKGPATKINDLDLTYTYTVDNVYNTLPSEIDDEYIPTGYKFKGWEILYYDSSTCSSNWEWFSTYLFERQWDSYTNSYVEYTNSYYGDISYLYGNVRLKAALSPIGYEISTGGHYWIYGTDPYASTYGPTFYYDAEYVHNPVDYWADADIYNSEGELITNYYEVLGWRVKSCDCEEGLPCVWTVGNAFNYDYPNDTYDPEIGGPGPSYPGPGEVVERYGNVEIEPILRAREFTVRFLEGPVSNMSSSPDGTVAVSTVFEIFDVGPEGLVKEYTYGTDPTAPSVANGDITLLPGTTFESGEWQIVYNSEGPPFSGEIFGENEVPYYGNLIAVPKDAVLIEYTIKFYNSKQDATPFKTSTYNRKYAQGYTDPSTYDYYTLSDLWTTATKANHNFLGYTIECDEALSDWVVEKENITTNNLIKDFSKLYYGSDYYGNVSLYAEFESLVTNYKISYDSTDATKFVQYSTESTSDPMASVEDPECPEHYDTFLGWEIVSCDCGSDDCDWEIGSMYTWTSSTKNNKGNITLKPKFNPIEYTITFHNNCVCETEIGGDYNGQVIFDDEVGTEIYITYTIEDGFPGVPGFTAFPGCEFVEWHYGFFEDLGVYSEETWGEGIYEVEGIDVSAHCRLLTYTIEYYSEYTDEDTNTPVGEEQTFAFSTDVYLYEIENEDCPGGYIFNGWEVVWTDAEGEYAQWHVGDTYYKYGELYEHEEGFDFLADYPPVILENYNCIIASYYGNVKLKAIFTPLIYTINYCYEDPTLNDTFDFDYYPYNKYTYKNGAVYIGDEPDHPYADDLVAGYELDYWEVVVQDTSLPNNWVDGATYEWLGANEHYGNITLKAILKPIQYTISLDPTGVTLDEDTLDGWDYNSEYYRYERIYTIEDSFALPSVLPMGGYQFEYCMAHMSLIIWIIMFTKVTIS